METISEEILVQLQDDLISAGWLMQAIEQGTECGDPESLRLSDTLRQLLLSGRVMIGNAIQEKSDYVAFVAWQGAIEELVARAVSRYSRHRDFGFWLCLTENVDRMQVDSQIQMELGPDE